MMFGALMLAAHFTFSMLVIGLVSKDFDSLSPT